MYKLYELKKLMEDEFPNMNFKYLDMKFLPDLCKAVSNRAYGLGGNSGTFAMGLSFFLRQFRIDSQFVVATDKQYTEDDVIHGQCTILHCGLMIEDQYSMIFDANGMTNQSGFTEYCMKTFHNDCPYFYIFDTNEYIENIPDIIRYGTKYSIDVGRYYDLFNEEYIKLEKANKLIRENKEDIKRYNKLLKNYVIRANKQLPNGIKISDELRDEVLDFWKKKNKDYSNLTKMDIIYRCPPTISKKWIKKYKDLGVKYNPQN